MDARSLTQRTGTHGRIAHLLGMAVLVAGSIGLAPPASAQTSDLHGAVWTTQNPGSQQSFVSAKYATLSGLKTEDAIGNKADAGGSLATPEGSITLCSHACSGGRPGWGGQANGSANGDVTLDYLITSPTLVTGTPVQVRVAWAECAVVKAIGQDMGGVNTSAWGSAYSQVVIYVNYSQVENRSGTYSSRHSVPDGYYVGNSGSLNPSADSSDHVYTVLVGQVVSVFMTGYASSTSSAELGTTDGDVQMTMVWGVTSMDPNASAVLSSDHSEAAPPAAMATEAHAVEIRPARPSGLLPCFRIPTQPATDSTCASGSATFTVAALGGGPFTYTWRKGGVPIDNDTNPSAATATLSLTNLSAGDAGSYDCVITNPCGDISSDAATLTVCAVSIDEGHPQRGTRLAASRPAPFRASTTLMFELATSGEASLEVFDLQGARVRTLTRGWHRAGHTEIVWHGEDDAGHRVPAGVYFVRLQARGFSGTQRIVALR